MALFLVPLVSAKLESRLPLRFRTRKPLIFHIVRPPLQMGAKLFFHLLLDARTLEQIRLQTYGVMRRASYLLAPIHSHPRSLLIA